MSRVDYPHGTRVQWKWGSGTGTGKIAKKFTEKVSRTIDGSEVTRDATEDDPAYLIEQEDGGRVLKSGSEIQKAAS
ncbi:MAG: hypothetical protein CMN30_03695 [Sandaracinus sp.]|mgnify:CR=1 FL=1|nr:hypothetical protein [Sandaracinus sp.]|tara:strand:+ start:3553 stop:3780 length:228 start_codon:yes stop_codon:yes gene_type:complete